MAVKIKTNALRNSNVLIKDIGLFIRTNANGGPETFTNKVDLDLFYKSLNVRELLTDDIYGANNSTLILIDPNSNIDIPQEDAVEYLDNLIGSGSTVTVNSWFGGW